MRRPSLMLSVRDPIGGRAEAPPDARLVACIRRRSHSSLRHDSSGSPFDHCIHEALVTRTFFRLIAAATLSLGASMATAPIAAAQDMTRETIGDWTKVCAPGGAPCVIEQIGRDSGGESALNMQVERLAQPQELDGQTIEAVANILTPLAVLLQQGLRLQIDGGEVQASPFFLCQQNGCVVRAPLRPELLNALRRGARARLSYVELEAGQAREVSSDISLAGFTRAFEALR